MEDDLEGLTNDEVKRSAAQLQAHSYDVDSSEDNINLYMCTTIEDVPSSEGASDADIINSITQPQDQVDGSDSEAEPEENNDCIMTARQANETARGVVKFLERQSALSVSQLKFYDCRNVIKVNASLKARNSKLSRVTDFFCDVGS